MKKLSLSFLLIFATIVGFSQKNQVVSAFNYHRNGKLDKAKEAIDKATENPKTSGMAKTWYYRGNIYLDIAQSPIEAFKNLDPDALSKAKEAYNKALELDTKKQFTDEIMKRIPILADAYFYHGAELFNTGIEAKNSGDTTSAKTEFLNAMKSFEEAYKIYQDVKPNDTVMYYAAVTAEMGGEYDKALQYLQQLIQKNYNEPGIYVSMGNILYQHKKDNANAEKYFKEGIKKFPDDLNLVLNLSNFYLATNQTQKAIDGLQKAASMDSTNASIFFAIGAKYNEIVDDTTSNDAMREDAFNKAIEAYQKAIQLKNDYFDAYYNMGALYVNKAASIQNTANTLPLDETEKYNELVERAKDMLQKSIPYLQKAHQLDPSDRNTMYTLKEIYTRLNMPEELKKINEELK